MNDSSSNIESKIFVKGKNKKNNLSFKSYKINVNEIVKESDYYSDYLYEFNGIINNIENISISDYNFPVIYNEIKSNNSELIINMDDEEKFLEIENGKYELIELFDDICLGLKQYNSNFTIFKNMENKIIIENLDNKEFEMINSENSLLKSLGFLNNNYSGKTKYIAEKENSLEKEYYLFFENINNKIPFLKIKNNNIEITPNYINDKIRSLDAIIINFKDEKNNLIDFNEKIHEFTLNFQNKEINELSSSNN